MPCYEPRGQSSYNPDSAQHLSTISDMQDRLDKLTRMLCSLCQKTDAATRDQVPELSGWWKQHERWDKERK